MSTRDEIRSNYPGLAKATDTGRRPRAAIKLFCIECMGGNRADAAACETRACPLWGYAYREQRGSK